MTFATEKDKPASDRFMLVRLQPSRDMTSTLASAGGGVYTATFSYPIAEVRRGTTTLTETTSNPPSVNDTFYHNESDGTFKVKLASAPSSSTNVVVVDYYLFYTSGAGVSTYEDPADSATSVRDWEPRIVQAPRIKQGVRNIAVGVFSFEETQLEIVNTDYAFQAYMTEQDSFREKEVRIWLCINSVAARQDVYTGSIRSVSVGPDSVSIAIYDTFSKLDQSCFMGDSADEAYFFRSASSFPDLDPEKNVTPCPLILAAASPHRFLASGDVSVTGGAKRLDPESMPEAVCTSYDPEPDVTNNRTWGLCRVPTSGIRAAAFPALSSYNTLGAFFTFTFDENDFAADGNVRVGDVVEYTWTGGGGGTGYSYVIKVVPSVAGSAVVYVKRHDGTSLSGTVTIDGLAVPSIVIVAPSGQHFYPKYDLHYTASTTTTSGGNEYVEVTFVNDFEADMDSDHDGGSSSDVGVVADFGVRLAPATHRVHYRVRVVEDDLNHADVLQQLCEGAGLTCDSSSFAAAASALDVNAHFMIPTFGEMSYGTCRDYAEKILTSTVGYLRLDDSNEVQYKLLETPSPTATVDSDLTIGAVTVDVDFNDIVTEITAFNRHITDDESVDSADPPTITEESVDAKRLHGITKSEQLEHVLVEFSSRIDEALAIRSRRKVIYTFKTATEHLDALIGDDITLEHDAVLGGSGTADLKIIGLDKGVDDVVVQAAAIEGL